MLMGVLVFSGMAVFSNKIALQAKMRSSAYQVARQQMETLKSTSFDRLNPVADTTFDIPADVIASLPGNSNGKYQVQGVYNIQAATSTLKQANVRIRWRNASTPEGRSAPWSEVRLGTILVKPGSVTTNPSQASTNGSSSGSSSGGSGSGGGGLLGGILGGLF